MVDNGSLLASKTCDKVIVWLQPATLHFLPADMYITMRINHTLPVINYLFNWLTHTKKILMNILCYGPCKTLQMSIKEDKNWHVNMWISLWNIALKSRLIKIVFRQTPFPTQTQFWTIEPSIYTLQWKAVQVLKLMFLSVNQWKLQVPYEVNIEYKKWN